LYEEEIVSGQKFHPLSCENCGWGLEKRFRIIWGRRASGENAKGIVLVIRWMFTG